MRNKLQSISPRAKRGLLGAAGAILLWLAVIATLRIVAASQIPTIEFIDRGPGTTVLVVIVHGASGAESRNGLLSLAQDVYPSADILAPSYFDGLLGLLSNADPYAQADVLEQEIHLRFRERSYQKIVLVGHSFGAMLLRKVIVWADGEESDRPGARRGRRDWLERIERFVSLAGINRGWSLDPKPAKMGFWTAAAFRMGVRLGQWTGTAGFMLGLRRGSPFVADLRIQWLESGRRLRSTSANQSNAPPGLPLTIHILGADDDIVSNEDSRDVCVASAVKFVTLPATGHRDIADIVATNSTSYRARIVRHGVGGDPDTLDVDQTVVCPQDPEPERLVFVVHGIRDYADWGEVLADEIASAASAKKIPLTVEPPKYGWFPMAPFLLQPDRQEKVRWFMDQYTDAIATYPNAREIDFIGHSNGTYLLGAALLRYRTIRIRYAYLAGSVLPQRFPWNDFVPHRIRAVRNVVGSGDWVVGIFPRLFEQIAEWGGIDSVHGTLDLGAAGFRGFQELANGAVRNIKFADGGHGVGVNVSNDAARHALVSFALDGITAETDKTLMQAFENTNAPTGWVDIASRVSWLLWAVLTCAVIAAIAFLLRWRWWAGLGCAAIIIGLLNSI